MSYATSIIAYMRSKGGNVITAKEDMLRRQMKITGKSQFMSSEERVNAQFDSAFNVLISANIFIWLKSPIQILTTGVNTITISLKSTVAVYKAITAFSIIANYVETYIDIKLIYSVVQ